MSSMKFHRVVCLVLLFSHATFADKCAKEDGNKVKYDGCSGVDATLQTASESYEMRIEASGVPMDPEKEIVFRFGGCEVLANPSKTTEKEPGLTFVDIILTFPIQVSVSRDGVTFTGKNNKPYPPPSCKAGFTKFEDGFKTALKISGEVVSQLTITVTGLLVPSKPILPVWAWVLIALVIFALVLVGTAVAVYFLFWKKRAARKKARLETVRVDPKKAAPQAAITPKKNRSPPKLSKEKSAPTATVEQEKTRDQVSIDQLICIERPAPAEPQRAKKARRAIEQPPTATISESVEPPLKLTVPAPFRYDIVELTGVDKQTTNITEDRASIANTIEDDFLARFPDVPPSYPSGMVAEHVMGHEVLHELLGLNQAERRFFIYFEGNSEQVHDAVTEVLAQFGSHKPRNIMVRVLIRELANIKQIAIEVYRSLYFEDKSKATLSWSFKSVEELLGLPVDKLEKAISVEPPTRRQRRWIEVDLTRIKREIDGRTFQSIESPILVVLDARIKFMREAFKKLTRKEASRPGFYTLEGVLTSED